MPIFNFTPLARPLLWVLLPLSWLFFAENTHAQSTSQISGIVNRYAAVLDFDSCVGKVIVSDTTGFRTGESILIFQMQGATIFSSNNFLYGVVNAMNFAGRYERAEIANVEANAIFLANRPVYSFLLDGQVQLVTLPHFDDVVVSDTLRPLPWNGQIGGIVALDVAGTLTLDAPIVADGAGFRGATSYVAPSNNCTWVFPETGYAYALGNWRGGPKGEGIAIGLPGSELGRGPQSTGGGGGNDHNSGGGGGANVSDGGDGGDNDEPSLFGCDGYYPGIGGYEPFSLQNRLFLGGGGGAGHTNNLFTGNGANGGGLIFVRAGSIVGANPKVSANGAAALTSTGDGAGGGGAGGSIWLEANSVTPALIVRAIGGRGGNSGNQNGDRCLGPGGGGAGGRIVTNVSGANLIVQGGQPGIVQDSQNGCNGGSNGAESGDVGLVQSLPNLPSGTVSNNFPSIVQQPVSQVVCAGDSLLLSTQISGGATQLQWQVNEGFGWNDLVGADSLTALVGPVTAFQNGWQYRCRIVVAGCYTTTTQAATLGVTPLPVASFDWLENSYNSFIFNPLNASGNAGQSWNFGDGSPQSSQLNPTHTYAAEGTYVVTYTSWNTCDTVSSTQLVSVVFPPSAAFVAPADVAVCGSAVVTFQNNSTGTGATYAWAFAGGTPATSSNFSPQITYTTPGQYTATLTVTNSAGTSTASQVVTIAQIAPPTASATYTLAPDGSVQFDATLANTTGQLWDFGDGSPTSPLPDPAHTYPAEGQYTATLTWWNACDTLTLEVSVVTLLPPVAAFWVADTVYGCGVAQAIFANSSSGSGVAYAWSFLGGMPDASNETNPIITYGLSGNYAVTLLAINAAGSSTETQNFWVEILDFPQAGFLTQDLLGPLVQFQNESIGQGNLSWDFGDPASGADNTSNLPNPTHEYPAGGVYTVTLSISGPCGVSILQQQIEVDDDGVRTDEVAGFGSIRVWPNPTTGLLTLDFSLFEKTPLSIQLLDATGRVIFFEKNKNYANPLVIIDLQNAPAGVYTLRVELEGGVWVQKIVRSGR
jgi:PKD repeat protein